jgi:quercetin dioxygenase-like cupin family protein
MPELIPKPSRVAAAGQPPKLIDEYVGLANTGQAGVSIARMRSPSGWAEPGQRPEFDEFTIVLRGALVVESEDGQMTVQAGQTVHTRLGEWVRYSTPGADGAEYISVCPLSPLTRFTGMSNLGDAAVWAPDAAGCQGVAVKCSASNAATWSDACSGSQCEAPSSSVKR